MTKKLLLVEDDVAERQWVQQVIAEMVDVDLVHAQDGVEAIEYLRAHPIGSLDSPTAVFLDLMLPNVNGFQVLREMQRLANFRRIPVVVFTTSSAQADVYLSYEFGANAFVVKPNTPVQYQKVVRIAAEFWLHHNVLPPLRGGGFER